MDDQLEAEVILAEKMLMDTVKELGKRGIKPAAILINMLSAATAFASSMGFSKVDTLLLIEQTWGDGERGKKRDDPKAPHDPNLN